ncbi:MAG: aminotransferase class I/II-fold pyridoxal phosphate-dependent enzyme [Ignavibacteria bacterium]|nr:aminotransferase class I/II-fold pyridoxal phosphate-dependent enzyme [Ignavibacteria bacterium]
MNKLLNVHKGWREKSFPEDAVELDFSHWDDSLLNKYFTELMQKSISGIPAFHPRYVAQMLKDPSLPAVLGYFAFILSNPNNHAYEGGPQTTEMEMEVTDMLLAMCGIKGGWGHLTSGGSLANTEALWAIRDYKNNKGKVYFSEASHYSWKRICSILQINSYSEVPYDNDFHMDLNILEECLKKEPAMAVIVNMGSTGTGSVDNLEGVLALREKYGFHIHVDAAYGGFFRTTILNDAGELLPYSVEMGLSEYTYRQYAALKDVDSITIDPHKQGQMPYGAGAVLYKDEALRTAILNSAPYTYHMLDKPNIGMWSLEGSRPGAMAAACWLTYKTMPLNRSGIGSLLTETLMTAQKFTELCADANNFILAHKPDLDITCFYLPAPEPTVRSINKQTVKIYQTLSVENPEADFILSKFVLHPESASRILPGYSNSENEDLILLRTVFMKHWYGANDFYYVRELIARMTEITRNS